MKPFSLNLRGRLWQVETPLVMGIVNITPDSFYAPSRTPDAYEINARVAQMIADGADILDIGGYSTRPGADEVDEAEETRRLERALCSIRKLNASIPVSVDTFRASVARRLVEMGADIINDISGGTLDPDMFPTVAELGVPYILTHTRGNPKTMGGLTDYPRGVAAGVIEELSGRLHALRQLGVADVIVDPGFGFAKTVDQNFELLRDLPLIGEMLECPLLVGLSRKSMIWRPLGITPSEALGGTICLNTLALERGASILRVHDLQAARQTLLLTSKTLEPPTSF